MERVEVDGMRIAYERAGSGPVVALLHGFVGDSRSTWAPQIEALSSDFTVVAWDAPGAGGSSDPPEWFRAEHYADCFVAFLGALGVESAHVGGLSFGGIVALSVAERRPDVLRSLALVSAYAGWAGSLPTADVEARRARCLALSAVPRDEFVSAMVPSMFSPAAPESAVAAFAASIARTRPDGFRAMTLASAEADLRRVLPSIAVPTLLLYGDADIRAPGAVAEGLRNGIPSSRLVTLPGVGHAASIEAPEAVNRELLAFLREIG